MSHIEGYLSGHHTGNYEKYRILLFCSQRRQIYEPYGGSSLWFKKRLLIVPHGSLTHWLYRAFQNHTYKIQWGVLHNKSSKNVHIIMCPEILPL
jgi:hypothetical protein